MGAADEKRRKPRIRLRKVPRAEETTNLQLAGLTNNAGGEYGNRLGHSSAGKPRPLNRFGAFLLWCLGRRKAEQPPMPEKGHQPEQ
jgi:hypothetical protein